MMDHHYGKHEWRGAPRWFPLSLLCIPGNIKQSGCFSAVLSSLVYSCQLFGSLACPYRGAWSYSFLKPSSLPCLANKYISRSVLILYTTYYIFWIITKSENEYYSPQGNTVYKLQYTNYNIQIQGNTVNKLQYTNYNIQIQGNTVYKLQFTNYKIQITVHKLHYKNYTTQIAIHKLYYSNYNILSIKYKYNLQVQYIYKLQCYKIYNTKTTIYNAELRCTIQRLRYTIQNLQFFAYLEIVLLLITKIRIEII